MAATPNNPVERDAAKSAAPLKSMALGFDGPGEATARCPWSPDQEDEKIKH
jgi:hypothetical protein